MTSLDAAAVTVHRTGSGPAVVLLHCLGVDHHFWDDTLTRLGGAFDVLRYDLPGHGASPVPRAGYSIEDLSEQLARILDRERIERAHVVGISLGGLIAQHFAATYPHRVHRLVLVDTTPRYTDELKQMWVERAAIARTHGVKALVDPLLTIWFSDAFVAANPPAVQYVRDVLTRTSGHGYAQACEALAAADVRALAARISAPTRVVCGDDDIPSFRDAAHWLATEIPNATLAWLPRARHASVLEQPEAFSSLLLQDLRQ